MKNLRNSNSQFKSINGKKIRRQYFNFIYVIAIMFALMLLTLLVLDGYVNMNVDEDVSVVGFMVVYFGLPMFLSALNLFFFGSVVCILNEDGLIYSGSNNSQAIINRFDYDDIIFIPWHKIEKMTFYPPFPTTLLSLVSGKEKFPAKVEVVTSDENTEIHEIAFAPLYLLLQARKYKKKIKITIDKGLLLFYFGLPVVMPVLIVLFEFFE